MENTSDIKSLTKHKKRIETQIILLEILIVFFGIMTMLGVVGEAEASDQTSLKVFEIFVVIGVAGEVFVGIGVLWRGTDSRSLQDLIDSETERLQEEAIREAQSLREQLELAQKDAKQALEHHDWRTISEDQAKKLRDDLAKFGAIKADMLVCGGDSEIVNFSDQLLGILKSAGWIVEKWSVCPSIAMRYFGVSALMKSGCGDLAIHKAMDALHYAFNKDQPDWQYRLFLHSNTPDIFYTVAHVVRMQIMDGKKWNPVNAADMRIIVGERWKASETESLQGEMVDHRAWRALSQENKDTLRLRLSQYAPQKFQILQIGYGDDEAIAFAQEIRSALTDCGWTGEIYSGFPEPGHPAAIGHGIAITVGIGEWLDALKAGGEAPERPATTALRSAFRELGIRQATMSTRHLGELPIPPDVIEIVVGPKPPS